MRMKQNCNGCKAFNYDGRGSYKCNLGFNTKNKEFMGVVVGLIPVEPCPKPKTSDLHSWYYQLKSKGVTKEEILTLKPI